MDTSRIEAAAMPGYPDRSTLQAADPVQRRRMLAEFVTSVCARLTGRPVDDEQSLFLESLQATELQMVIESRLEIELSLLDLVPPFGIDDLVSVLDDALAAEPARSQVPVLVADVTGRYEPFGLTDVQHAYWLGRSGLFDLGDVSTHVFLEFEAVDFDVQRVESVLSQLVERHDMLRAVIRSDGRQQVLADVPAIRVVVEDLTGCSEAEADSRVQDARDRLSHEVRPSGVWPLFEVSGQLMPSGVTRVYLSLDLLIADAASIRVLLAEFGALFEAPGTTMKPLGLAFRDYVTALTAAESGEAFDRARAYWSARVDSLPAAPQLPVVSPAGGGTTRFVRRSGGLDPERWERLRVAAGRCGVTVSAVLLAAYAEVLGVWGKSSRFTVNVTVGDRMPVHPEVEQVVGDFTSLVLVEVDTSDGETGLGSGFGDRVRRVQEQLWRDLEHRAFGGVRVLRELAQARGPVEAAMPVVFTSVLGAPMPGRDGVLPGLGRLVGGISQTPQVFLDYQVYEQAGALVVSWDAVEALFEPGVLDAMFGAHQELLERLADDPQAWSRAGSAVSCADSLEVAAAANDTAGPVPAGLLHAGVARWAVECPEAVAVCGPFGSLTYAQVMSRAKQVARRLRAIGVQPGDVVGVVMVKGWEQVVAVLGVLTAGAAYLPVDPGLPVARRELLLARTGVTVVLTQSTVAEAIAAEPRSWPSDVRVCCVDIAEEWMGFSSGPVESVGVESDLAYVIFTSGSTGEPKGVMIDHRGALNTVVDVNRRFGVGPGDRVLGVSSLSFDLSVWDVFGVLSAGATLVLPGPGTDRDPGHWVDLTAEYGVTVWNSVPALFELLTEAASATPDRVQSLRLAMLSGDWIPLSLPDRARELVPGLEVVSLGGATEASIWSIFHRTEPAGPDADGWVSVPYGRPLTNQSFHILDSRLMERPVWVAGELFIGGVGVALGYWDDRVRTAGSFVVHPVTGERLYRTGDLGRRHPDGTIEFLGREDTQVKIGGYRIELGEIEAALSAHPRIGGAVVVAHGDPRGSRRLVAYITQTETDPADLVIDLTDGNALSADDVREWTRRRLPDYMSPQTVITLDALPLTGNGKIDRKCLPDPTQHSVALADSTPPRTPTEHALTEIWAGLLNTTLGIHTNLLDLGADSLLALRATAAANTHGIHLELRHVLQHPTIAEQAGLAVPAVGSVPVVVPDPAGRFEPFGLTDVQHAYWLGRSGLFELGDVSTHVFLEFESMDFDVRRVEWVLSRLVRRHDMLRAVVRPDGRQQVLPEVPTVRVTVEDLSGCSAATVETRVGVLRDRLSHEVRPAHEWPLFEVSGQFLPSGMTRVYLSLDLLVADAASIRILLSEFALLFENSRAELTPVNLLFRDYVAALVAAESGEVFDRAREYWLARVDSLAAAPELPVQTGSGVATRFVRRSGGLDPERWERLRLAAGRCGVTVSAVLLAAYAEVLGVWGKSSRFTVNVTVGDRLPVHPEVEQVLGDFTSLVLVEVDVSASELGFADRVRRVQEQLWRDLEHRAFGGIRMMRELARSRGPANASMPVVFTSVLGQEMPGRDGVLPGLGRLVGGISQTPQVFLDYQVYEQAGALVVSWDAVEALFEPGVLDAMFAAHEDLLKLLADDPQVWEQAGSVVPLGRSVAGVDQLDDGAGVVPEGLLHAGVARWAVECPEAVAVCGPFGSLTYAQVMSRARQVARRLQSMGVGIGDLVGVCMEKGWEQVVAVLGVLEAGAAYVPVDPALPAARRELLFSRTEVAVVLTQSVVSGRLAWPATVTVWCVDAEAEWVRFSSAPLEAVGVGSDLAYVIFTSGSTGEPKGVMIDHRGALNTVVDVNRRFGVGPGDRVLGVSSLSFDLSVWDVFGVLSAGATLVLPGPGTDRDPGHWLDLVSEHRVSVWNSVPALFELFLEASGTAERVASLRLVMLSGDWISVSLPDRTRALIPGVEVISLGGATEASIWSIFHRTEPAGPDADGWVSVPYGRPLLNQNVQVLDSGLMERPVWVAGELFIGGVGVALGYWDDRVRTAGSFVIHPVTGERLYRTGDLGRRHPDGTIEFLGREDTQVKIGGYRIELGEIEAALSAHPQITAAVVVAHGDPRGSRRLVAYVAENPLSEGEIGVLSVEQVRSWTRSRLPDYMTPQTVIVLDALPLTANGKLDRKNLPDPTEHAVTVQDTTAARTPTEHVLTGIWATLLDTTPGIHTNLFDLGADSLLALRATAAADTHGIHLELRHILQHPTIAEQAGLAGVGSAWTDTDDPIGPCGLTPSQSWFLEQDIPGRNRWNDASFLLTLQRPLQTEHLVTSVRSVLEHHDALRLRFAEQGGQWRAEVAPFDPETALPFSVHDLSYLTGRAQREAVTEVCDQLQGSLDISQGPLLRVAYFDLGERPHCLLFLAHWLAVDHYSGRVLLEDLLTTYSVLETGAPATLPGRTASFRSWTRRLAEYAGSEEVRDQLEVWTAPDRAAVDRIRQDHSTGPNDLASMQTLTVRIDHDLTQALVGDVPSQLGVDVAELLCSAVLLSLPLVESRPRPRRLLVDLERHGRDVPVPGSGVGRTVGRFSTITPVLVDWDPRADCVDVLFEVAARLRSEPNLGAGYGLLRYLSDDSQTAAELAARPGAEVGVNYLGRVDEVFLRSDLLSVPRMSFGRQRTRDGLRPRLLDVVAYVIAGQLTISVSYSSHRFEGTTVQDLTDGIGARLRELVEAAQPVESSASAAKV